MAALCSMAIHQNPALSSEPEKTNNQAPQARLVIERGLTFLEKDTVKWRQERGCATCHHGTMTILAMSEARSQGYAVKAAALADFMEGTMSRFIPRLDLPRDPRPGWTLVSTPETCLGVMSQHLPVLSREEVNIVARHLARHQEEDGAWVLPPPANGAPSI